MQTRTRNPFTTIHTEGALLPSDLLQRVLAYNKDIPGLTPEGYHLSGEKLNEAINRSWNRLQGAWAAFKTSRGRLGLGDAGTGLTRERWLLPLFDELDYGRLQIAKGLEIDGKPYAISHMWANVPIHLVGCGVDLEKRSAGVVGASKASPHSLLQEYLNRSPEAQWGLVSNGLRLRVLRDNATLTRQAFLEFDLEAMFEGEVYADFALLWLICHQSRFENLEANREDAKNAKEALGKEEKQKNLALLAALRETCFLEQWSKLSQEQGTRALEYLRKGVEQAIAALGSGFLRAPANQKLRADLRSGALSTHDYYRQLLRLVYRLIFLFVAEDRDLLFEPASTPKARERYLKYYSLQRLRRLASLTRGSRHPDLYEALKVVMRLLAGVSLPILNSQPPTPYSLALPILGGFLFSEQALPDLEPAELTNESLLTAIRCLTTMEEGQTRRAVDYKNMGARELGSVYESLLELHATVNTDSAQFELLSVAGNERKTTGSFFTHEDLINELLNSALDPVIAQALEGAKSLTTKDTKGNQEPQSSSSWSLVQKQIAALLALKLIDPACGSGHFLVAAAHRLARRLAQVRTGEVEPTPDAMRAALREVISHCIYGVDINPMSVELCKVSLWMESMEPGKPLSFLDAHIQCGNSLVGVGPMGGNRELAIGNETTHNSLLTTPNSQFTTALEIPDEAFNAVTGDHKPTAALLKKRNKQERAGQESLFITVLKSQEDLDAWLAERTRELEGMPEDDAAQVQAKAEAYKQVNTSNQYQKQKQVADLWTAAFFWQIKESKGAALEIVAPTQGQLRRLRAGNQTQTGLLERVTQLSLDNNFFHWPLAFPDVFMGDGNRQSGAGSRQSEGEAAAHSPLSNPHSLLPDLRPFGFDCVLGNPPWERIKLQEEEFFAQRDPEIATAANKAARQKLIDLLTKSNPALAQEFENAKHAAECSSKFMRASDRYQLTAVGDVNTYALFAGHGRDLMSAKGRMGIILPTGIATDDTTKDFFGDLVEKRSIVSLFDFENREAIFPGVHRSYKFCLLTLSGSPVSQSEFSFFATRTEHLRDPLRRFSLAPYEIALFNPNTHTMPVFRTRIDAELTRKIYSRVPVLENERTGQNPWGIRFSTMFHMSNDSGLFEFSPREGYLRFYEAKLIHQFDHRWATYNGLDIKGVFYEDKTNPHFSILPRYWVSELEINYRLGNWKNKWMIGFRDIARATDERTAIFCLVPRVGIGNMLIVKHDAKITSCLLGNLSCFVFDYAVRHKVGGTHINIFIAKQFPVLPPSFFSQFGVNFIAPRVLELVYTAYDLKPFAEDMWKGALTLPSPEGRGFKQLPSPAGGRA
ncbi:MAG: DNA methyltransferase, partial [Chloroflexota bacterium]